VIRNGGGERERLRAESDRWQAAGCGDRTSCWWYNVLLLLGEGVHTSCSLQSDVLLHQSVGLQFGLKCFVGMEWNEMAACVV
jgi:hypothetical protein